MNLLLDHLFIQVKAVKTRIAKALEQRGVFVPAKQLLVAGGRTLKDELTLAQAALAPDASLLFLYDVCWIVLYL